MEWVETTGRTIEEAKELALDQLGVDDQEAEFEVLEEPKPGLFGRVKGQARVRARVKPKTPQSRDERRRRPTKNKERSGSGGAPRAARSGADDRADTPAATASEDAATASEGAAETGSGGRSRGAGRGESVEPSGPRLDSEIAEREARVFLQGVIEHFGLEADIEISIDDQGDLSATISGRQMGRLIGPHGGVISAVEELTRTRLQHVAGGGSTPRFKLDIGDYRATRREHLEALVDDVVDRVRTTGKPHLLDVVVSSERKLVHDRVGETADDLGTHSEGEDPVRRVMVSLAVTTE